MWGQAAEGRGEDHGEEEELDPPPAAAGRRGAGPDDPAGAVEERPQGADPAAEEPSQDDGEGDRGQRIKLDAAPWSVSKLSKRAVKMLIWLLIAIATGEPSGVITAEPHSRPTYT